MKYCIRKFDQQICSKASKSQLEHSHQDILNKQKLVNEKFKDKIKTLLNDLKNNEDVAFEEYN